MLTNISHRIMYIKHVSDYNLHTTYINYFKFILSQHKTGTKIRICLTLKKILHKTFAPDLFEKSTKTMLA